MGAALGVIVATWASVVAIMIATESSHGPHPAPLFWRVMTPLGASMAWFAVWAWVTERWALAAAGFFMSLAVPAGYDNILSPVILVGLVTAASVEAFGDRRKRLAKKPPTRTRLSSLR
jgi:uncharacterized membrane protein